MTAADLILPPPSEGSREVAARVARARDIQAERYAAFGLPHVRVNAQANGPVLEEVARADRSGMALLRDAADSMPRGISPIRSRPGHECPTTSDQCSRPIRSGVIDQSGIACPTNPE